MILVNKILCPHPLYHSWAFVSVDTWCMICVCVCVPQVYNRTTVSVPEGKRHATTHPSTNCGSQHREPTTGVSQLIPLAWAQISRIFFYFWSWSSAHSHILRTLLQYRLWTRPLSLHGCVHAYAKHARFLICSFCIFNLFFFLQAVSQPNITNSLISHRP